MGDLANIDIPANGNLKKDIELKNVSLNSLTTATGTSLVIHANADDGKTDPSGNSGDRIYCGVLTEAVSAATKTTK